MARMVPKQVHITVEQDRLLKAKAKELGVSQSEVVRRVVKQVLDELDRIDRELAQELASASLDSQAKG